MLNSKFQFLKRAIHDRSPWISITKSTLKSNPLDFRKTKTGKIYPKIFRPFWAFLWGPQKKFQKESENLRSGWFLGTPQIGPKCPKNLWVNVPCFCLPKMEWIRLKCWFDDKNPGWSVYHGIALFKNLNLLFNISKVRVMNSRNFYVTVEHE